MLIGSPNWNSCCRGQTDTHGCREQRKEQKRLQLEDKEAKDVTKNTLDNLKKRYSRFI